MRCKKMGVGSVDSEALNKERQNRKQVFVDGQKEKRERKTGEKKHSKPTPDEETQPTQQK